MCVCVCVTCKIKANLALCVFYLKNMNVLNSATCFVQARHVEGGSAGLIPSQMLEEKRKAFVKKDVELAPAGMGTEKNKKTSIKQNIHSDCDLLPSAGKFLIYSAIYYIS